MTGSSAHILAIQHLRALAVLGVVLFHATQGQRPNFEVGAAGVDLFFVISGFILWTVTARRPVAPLAFLRRRLARVAPLYWLVTAAALAVVAVAPRAIPHVEIEPRHILLSLLFISHNDPVGAPFPVVDVGWSLNYEAFFYLVFALALLVDEARRAKVVTLTLLAVVAVGVITPALYTLGANMFLLEFAAGLWLARAWAAGRMPRPAVGLLLIGAGLAALAALYLSGYRPHLWRPLLWGGPSLAIAAGALALDQAGRLPDWPWLQRVGDASYAIYLTHTLTAPIAAALVGLQRPWALVPLIVLLGVGGGLAVHLWVERPLLRLFGATPRPFS